jgi:hypothetical protein
MDVANMKPDSALVAPRAAALLPASAMRGIVRGSPCSTLEGFGHSLPARARHNGGMTSRLHLLAFVALATLGGAALAADPPAAQSNSPEADASLYGESVTLPRQAAACAERIADYMPRFQPAYDAWRHQNEERIAIGSKFIHDQAKVGGVDADAGMNKLADADFERLGKTTIEKLANHCQLILESMAPPSVN